MQDNKDPSGIIKDFINLLKTAEENYNKSYEIVGNEDKKKNDFLHEIEFSKTEKDCSKISLELRESRKIRRAAKNNVFLYKEIAEFKKLLDDTNLLIFLCELLDKQLETEKFLNNEKVYVKRFKERAV